MSRWICMAGLGVLVACQGKDDESEADDASGGGSEEVPETASPGSDVCAAYSSDWSEDEASAHCEELGGERGTCPEVKLVGACSTTA